ncbi:MAG: two-CW domain-containing protein, partial [Bacillota bacterium]
MAKVDSGVCWEFLKCPEERKTKCPAFTEKRGSDCWKVPRTLCRGELQGTMAQKIGSCRKCNFYCSFHKIKVPVRVKIMGGFAFIIALLLGMGFFGLYELKLVADMYNHN